MAVYKQCITAVSPIRVTAGYPAYSNGGYHRGIDTVHGNLRAYAPEAGVVEVAQHWNGSTSGNQSWGNMIKVRMEDGTTWRAAHFAAQIWKVGDTISKGQFIGMQGRSGYVTGIHTHWEYADAAGNLMDPSIIFGIPNQVGTWDVEWDSGGGPRPGPTPWPTGTLPVWLLFKMAKGGLLL